ncbi:hypothetical protein C0995_002897 [Termitomyces sp. Mi166|nr:hypothetical protein C0995_002897 [Termitomyces sp. Mi166\
MWKRKGQDDEAVPRQTSLRFVNRTPGVEEEIWVLLTRHVTDSNRTSDYISLKVQLEDDLEGRSNFLDQTTIAAKAKISGPDESAGFYAFGCFVNLRIL